MSAARCEVGRKASTHLPVVSQNPHEAKSHMLSGKDDETCCEEPFLPGQEVNNLHYAVDYLSKLDKDKETKEERTSCSNPV